jgi:hypothetical protein
MDRTTVMFLIALNVLAGSVMWGRFSSTELGGQINLKAQAWLSNVGDQLGGLLGKGSTNTAQASCGLLSWPDFSIVSQRVVLPDGVQPAAGEQDEVTWNVCSKWW